MSATDLDVIHDAELIETTGTHLPAVTEPVDINDTLTDEAQEDLANSGRVNTRDTYQSQWDGFARWCADNGRDPRVPTREANLTSYISHLRRKNAPPGSLRLAIAAIAHMNARAGYPQAPKTEQALSIYQDHRYEWAAAGKGQRSSAPVDMTRLRQMLAACDTTTNADKRDAALLVLGYYTRGRASELVRYRVADAVFVTASLLVMTKRVSKNDKNSEGREYEIDDPDAIATIRDWIDVLDQLGQASPRMPLLRNVDQKDRVGPVSEKTGNGLTRQAVNLIVKALAERAGLDVAGDVTAHGLRAGVPTDLGAQGLSAGAIKEITGDWSSTEMVERYRKIGLRRAGKRTDSGRRSAALNSLRLQAP
ncbi:tyrosine-type recombinase/integrase [Streptomyces sp. NEAU-H3]|uniref:tyrosine-type recombinase/integrase n=1 Tax=Streptomyces sp. NEAU-H3 TaxID=2720636 RepID=UPI00143A9444|nr:tyrosine-type recombinase/integrase [Streptomyces sp. NEAU-H3]NJA56732.1 tyrosine-type recombinase/integrase [Streptomyces sp. NEAU-H3]